MYDIKILNKSGKKDKNARIIRMDKRNYIYYRFLLQYDSWDFVAS
ncbi:unnamed protein product [marine sediment metagenome]|uniref:Uncharacterized protein n=1 Tax=marine sediment metagenome TaxID=412755 RepID=X1HWP9_9ZZZZ